MKLRSRAIAFAVALVVVAPASSLHAQSADDKAAAERLFNDAKALLEQKNYEGACPKFAESLRLDPGIGVMLHLADCYEKQGKLASAWATFREAADLATKQGDSKRAEIATKHAAALEPRLSTLTITVATGGEVAGLVVTRNGSPVGKAQWGSAIPVDAGPHVIAATAPGRKKWESTPQVPAERAELKVTVPVLEVAATSATPPPTGAQPAGTPPDGAPPGPPVTGPDPTPPPTTSGLSSRQWMAVGVGGVGVIGLGLGTIFGLQAGSKLSDSNANNNCVGNHCNPTGGQLRNDAQSAATLSTIAFVVGAAALAGGAVLWFTAPKNAGPAVGLGGFTTGRDSSVVLQGRF